MRRLMLIATIVAVLAAATGSARAQPHQHGGDRPCHPTAQQKRAAAEFERATLKHVRKYEDPKAALDDEFRPWVDTPYKSVHHYVKYEHYYDWKILDPKRPEALVYVHSLAGPKLIGVMYSMEDPGRKPPDFGGCITTWHTHPQCRAPFGYSHIWEEDWGDCPPGWTDDGGSEQMLHVWTVPMHDGPYAFHPDDRWECWPLPSPC
jgi:hypothetical protein